MGHIEELLYAYTLREQANAELDKVSEKQKILLSNILSISLSTSISNKHKKTMNYFLNQKRKQAIVRKYKTPVLFDNFQIYAYC